VRRYPGRIAAIYIRDVRPGETWKLNDHIKEVAQEIRKTGVDMLLIQDTLAAAQHAHQKGLVSESCIIEVAKAVKQDLAANPIDILDNPPL